MYTKNTEKVPVQITTQVFWLGPSVRLWIRNATPTVKYPPEVRPSRQTVFPQLKAKPNDELKSSSRFPLFAHSPWTIDTPAGQGLGSPSLLRQSTRGLSRARLNRCCVLSLVISREGLALGLGFQASSVILGSFSVVPVSASWSSPRNA